jgi:hypothetical protein
MTNLKDFKPRPLPADFADRFPDGSYAVGRGADPRTVSGRPGDPIPGVPIEQAKPSKPPAKKRPVRPAAE